MMGAAGVFAKRRAKLLLWTSLSALQLHSLEGTFINSNHLLPTAVAGYCPGPTAYINTHPHTNIKLTTFIHQVGYICYFFHLFDAVNAHSVCQIHTAASAQGFSDIDWYCIKIYVLLGYVHQYKPNCSADSHKYSYGIYFTAGIENKLELPAV